MDALQEPLESNERLPSALSPSTLMERRIAAEGDHVGKQGSTASLLAFPRASELRQTKGAVASTASMIVIGATALDMHSEDKPRVVSLERAIARREDAREKHTDPGSSGSAGSSGEGARQARPRQKPCLGSIRWRHTIGGPRILGCAHQEAGGGYRFRRGYDRGLIGHHLRHDVFFAAPGTFARAGACPGQAR
ncbi:MAG: hypothetical protein ACREYE_13880 [Gammaproteobacteria bacterium]